MLFLYFFPFLIESKFGMQIPIGSYLFLRNGSFLFNSHTMIKAPGNLITIPALSTFRAFSIKNLYVSTNTEHFITNSQFLQRFSFDINRCHFSKFLKSPISFVFSDNCYTNKTDELQSKFSFIDCCFVNCNDINDNGGALCLINATSNLEFNSCTFTNCFCLKSGGAIYINNCPYVSMTDTQFDNCYIITNYVTQTFEFGGAIYISEVNGSINLDRLTFNNCHTEKFGGGSIYVSNSSTLLIQNTTINTSYSTYPLAHRTDGGGALILNVLNIEFRDITCINCSSRFGSGISVNTNVHHFDSYNISHIKGGGLVGINCTTIGGCFAFHSSNFTNLYGVSITDYEPAEGEHYMILFSSCVGKVSNIYFANLENSETGAFYFRNFSSQYFNNYIKDTESNYLELDCVIAEYINNYPNLALFQGYSGFGNIIIIINNLYAPNLISIESYDWKYSNFSFFRIDYSDCYYPTDKFTISEEFSESIEFTKTISFSESKSFSSSLFFIPSLIFSSSNDFTPSTQFTYSIAFSESEDFTRSIDFTYSSFFTKSDSFVSTINFTNSDAFTSSNEFTPSSEFRTRIPHPKVTTYNIGFGLRDEKGTRTDTGMVTIYVCAALLAVLLITVIIFASCKVHQTIPEELPPEVHDEFYFPDFDNLED